MPTSNFARNALLNSKRRYDCTFDQSLTPLKRNLMFVSVLSFAALNVSPKNGEYNVNLGVISGVIDRPELIFCGLLAVCLYHVCFFWIKCRHTIINSINYHKVEEFFMYELSASHAFHEYNKLVRLHLNTNVNMAVGSFNRSPKNPRENDNWKVRSQIQFEHIKSYPELLSALNENKHFEINENRGFAEIDFTYKATNDDYKFLNIHRDHFWLTKKSEFIEHVLPLILGYSAVIFLTYKITTLVLVIP
ncbi:hypothetical protein [Psychromonas aquimarina]|uniref:hypothetical protein n=1 Tax=Psychromonas aquimarina TaxID=444919 RepID=UPI0004278842|nr:hypothetical protein [Psychromonas aquimarina]